MRIRLALPDDIVSPATIAAALEASTVANEALAQRGALPDIERAIGDRLIRWRPEPFTDGEHFDLAPEVLRRGWGDCDDLAPWLAAQMRHEGEDARAIAIRSGPTKYHAVVERPDGQILDPSKWAGMGQQRGKEGVHGRAYSQIVGPDWNAMALMPHPRGGWGARADLALDGTEDHVSSAAWDMSPKRAMQRALAGASALAEGHDLEIGLGLSDLISTAAPMAGMALGIPPGLTAAALPMASSLLSSVMPGMGAPGGPPPGPGAAPAGGGGQTGVPQTVPISSPAGSRNKGGGNLTYVPGGGPIIVRF